MAFLCFVALIGQSPAVDPAPTPSLLTTEPDQVRRTALDVMMGSPLGLSVRLQRQLDAAPLYIEGSIGTFLFASGVGVGVRGEFKNELGQCDALIARPGVSVYLLASTERIYENHSVGVLAVDVDLAWQHRYGWNGIGEFGIKLGPGVTIGHSNTELFPIFGLYHGWRF